MRLSKEEEAELIKLEEKEELAQLKAEFDPEPSTGDQLIEGGVNTLMGGVKGLDFGRGATGGPLIAGALELLTGKDVYRGAEHLDAINPTNLKTFPTSDELFDRAGVPKGAKLSDYTPIPKDSFADVSLRGAGGLSADIISDPFTWLSGGLSAAAKKGMQSAAKTGLKEIAKEAPKGLLRRGAGAVVAPIAKGASKTSTQLAKSLGLVGKEGTLNRAGEVANKLLNPFESFNRSRAAKNYSNALEDVDRYAKQKLNVKVPPSQILQEAGFSGRMDAAGEVLAEINERAGVKIGATLDAAAERGAKLNLYDDFDGAMKFSSDLRKIPTPEAHDLASQVEKRIEFAWQNSPLDKAGNPILDVASANKLKSNINNLIKASGFAQGADAALATKARKAIAGDVSKGIEKAVQSTDDELFKTIKSQNKVFQSTSSDVIDKIVQVGNRTAEKRSLKPTIMDIMFGGSAALAASHNPGHGLLATAVGVAPFLKRASQSTVGRTARGKLGQQISQGARGVVDPLLRRGAMSTPLKSTWESVRDEQEQTRRGY